MRTSQKEFYILAMAVLISVIWAAWNLFHHLTVNNDLIKGIVTALLLMFLLYMYTCLTVFRQSKIGPLSFLLLSFGFVSLLLLDFALIYAHFGLISSDNCISHDSLDCLYFSIITLTTVGYGDFRPTPGVRIYAGLEALTGVIFFSVFISTLIHANNSKAEPWTGSAE